MKSFKVRNLIIGEGSPKICIPLVGKNRQEIIEAAEFAVESKADLYEFRGDYLLERSGKDEIIDALQDVRELITDKPLMFTLRSREEGGSTIIPKKIYLSLNLSAISLGLADIIDVELEKGSETINKLAFAAHEKGRLILISKHFFSKMPNKEKIMSELFKMQNYPSDMIKIAVMIKDERELLNLLDVSLAMKEKHADRPFAIIGMGRKGMLSRVTGGVFGSSLTFAKGSEASAPGQIEAIEVRRMMDIINSKPLDI